MYQKYQPCPPRVVSSLELLFGRGGTRVAQPLGHRWPYSVTESRRTTFSETASVRTTWDSSPAGSCPGAVDERLFFLGSNFSSERMTSDSSPADSFRYVKGASFFAAWSLLFGRPRAKFQRSSVRRGSMKGASSFAASFHWDRTVPCAILGQGNITALVDPVLKSYRIGFRSKYFDYYRSKMRQLAE